MAERKFDAVDLSNTLKNVSTWDDVIAHIESDVKVVPLYTDMGDVTGTEEMAPADYVTDTGRDGQFYAVMIDRNFCGKWTALATVSDYYAAIKPQDILRRVEDALGDYVSPWRSYNSYSGGRQVCWFVGNFDGLNGVDNVKMVVEVSTSIDTSKSHGITVVPFTEDGVPIYFDTGKSGVNFKAKHTKGNLGKIGDSHKMATHFVKEWNETIVPFISFLSDGDFSEEEVMALIDNVSDDAALPKSLRDNVKAVAKAQPRNGMYAVRTLCEEVQGTARSPMDEMRKGEKVGKSLTRRVQSLMTKKI